MKGDLSENVRQTVEQSRKAQHRSQQCRERSEELISMAKRLSTKLETARPRPAAPVPDPAKQPESRSGHRR